MQLLIYSNKLGPHQGHGHWSQFLFTTWGGLDLAILEYAEYARIAVLNKQNWALWSTPE